MIAPGRVAFLLLAAGRSSRFGGEKLLHEVGGAPLAVRSARAATDLPFARRIAVVRADMAEKVGALLPGFRCVPNPDPDTGMGRSLALGIGAAGMAEAVLVALADMPFVTADHLQRLMQAFDPASGIVASSGEGRHQPPVLFGRRHFPALEALSGDRGARALIARAAAVEAPPGTLRDIDRPSDLRGAD